MPAARRRTSHHLSRQPEDEITPISVLPADLPFQLQTCEFPPGTSEPPRSNAFAIYRIDAGCGTFWADATEQPYQAGQLLCFVPYQFIRMIPLQTTRITMLQFHANFLCVETFHAETGCSGLLFNDSCGIPVVTPDPAADREITSLLTRMQQELSAKQLAYTEVLLACTRILLIIASRAKVAQCGTSTSRDRVTDFRHPVVAALRDLIEQHYRVLHAPAAYAAMLHMTTSTLGRCVREQLGRTLTDLIRERILTHAKWQLLHTLKPVREIAAEVGFRDELYFSRLFRKATGVSPTWFREFETRVRGGRNLSMFSPQTSMHQSQRTTDSSSVSR